MSYILDALNKSNKERSADKAPDINQYGAPPSRKSGHRPLIIVSGICLLLFVNALLVYIWLLQPLQKNSDTTNNVLNLGTESHRPENPVIVQQQARTGTERLRRLSEMPPHIQTKIQSLSFSSHIYSEFSDLRAVSINGRRFGESEMVTSDLKLEQVTPDGIIMQFENQRFEVNVLNTWPDL